MPQKSGWASEAAEKLLGGGFVKEHDFSRADKANQIKRASAPAGCLCEHKSRNRYFFRSLFSPDKRGPGHLQARRTLQHRTHPECRPQADFRRKSSSLSLQPQSEQLRQQNNNTPTPTVINTARTVPNENKECANVCIALNLICQGSEPTQIAPPVSIDEP
jgi:hypothetical protein